MSNQIYDFPYSNWCLSCAILFISFLMPSSTLFLYPSFTLNLNFLRIMQQQNHFGLQLCLREYQSEEGFQIILSSPLCSQINRVKPREGRDSPKVTQAHLQSRALLVSSLCLAPHLFACSPCSRGPVFAEVRTVPKPHYLFSTYREFIPLPAGGRREHTEGSSWPEVTYPALARTDSMILISPQSPLTSIFYTLRFQHEILDGQTNNWCPSTVPIAKPHLANFHPRGHLW